MTNTATRKAVYVPSDMWNILAKDAKANYHSVTHELKDVLLSHYSDRLSTDNKSTTIQPVITDDNDDF